jgi:hypothetical protein
MIITEDASRNYIQISDSIVWVCLYIKNINTILITNCTEIRTNKERRIKLTDGSIKHGCYKQLEVTNALREYVRQVTVRLRFLKRKKKKKSGIFGELLTAHTKQFSPSGVSSLHWGLDVQVMRGYWRYYQKFL